VLLKATWDIRDAVLAKGAKVLGGQAQYGPQPKAWDPVSQKVMPLGADSLVGGPSPSKEALAAAEVMPEWLREAVEEGDFVLADREEWDEVPQELHPFFVIIKQ
jgi:hypothetical protein